MKRFNDSKISMVLFVFVAVIVLGGSSVNAAYEPIEITVLYDNYTLTEGCTPDWGFSCIIKGMEKCILFDTGKNGAFHQPQWRLGKARGPPQDPKIPHFLNWAKRP